jgi:hypothetical protein
MPGLVNRPDLDQLRRQARELLRAAASGEPTAVARIRAVSERMTLSAAQLALAREYGYRNWTALRAEVERRRSPLNRWSFGGAAEIETLAGRLLLEGLVASAPGCPYLCRVGGGSGRNGYEELRLQFRPRLDPLARRLRLTCTGSSEQITIDLDLALLACCPRVTGEP